MSRGGAVGNGKAGACGGWLLFGGEGRLVVEDCSQEVDGRAVGGLQEVDGTWQGCCCEGRLAVEGGWKAKGLLLLGGEAFVGGL
jgi:hypothetical protein